MALSLVAAGGNAGPGRHDARHAAAARDAAGWHAATSVHGDCSCVRVYSLLVCLTLIFKLEVII